MKFLQYSVIIASILTLASCQKKSKSRKPTHQCSSPELFYSKKTQVKGFSDSITEEKEQTINRCLFVESDEEICTLEQMPLMGSQESTMTPEIILQNTFTSDDWMKKNFEKMLHTYPQELLDMFRHATAVVISRDVNPSHYWALHGAIVLSPNGMWLTEIEKQSIPQSKDCRMGNFEEAPIHYRFATIEKKDGIPLWDLTRTLENQAISVGLLLAHELAHAIDYVSDPTEFERIEKLYEAIEDENILSNKFYNGEPSEKLDNSLLEALANYFYEGEKLSDEIINTPVSKVMDAFEESGAATLYSHYNSREDFATLIEYHLGRKYWGVSINSVVLERIKPGDGCNKHKMLFSQSNRDLDSNFNRRLQRAISLTGDVVAGTDNRLELNFTSHTNRTKSDLCSFLRE